MAVTLPKPSVTRFVDDAGTVVGVVDKGDRTDDTLLQLNGKARAGTTVEILDGDKSLGTTGVDKSGNWVFTTPELDDGSHTFKVIATNAKGDTSPASDTYRITVDTLAPAAPAFTVTDDAGRITGILESGVRSDDASPLLTGKTEARATVEIFDGRKSLATVTANNKGNWSFTAEDLKDGLHTLRAIATDIAGNASDASTFKFTIDTTPPKAPSLDSVTDNTGTLQGRIGDNGSTNDKTPTLAGKGVAGSTVELFDADQSLGTVTVAKNSNWTFTTSELADGTHTFTALTFDKLGTYSAASNALTINLDTLPPSSPQIASITDNAARIRGNVTDGGYTNDTTPTLRGTAEANSTLRLFNGDTRLGAVKADKTGIWVFTPALSR